MADKNKGEDVGGRVMNPSPPSHKDGLEQVLCFPRELLDWAGPFPDGILRGPDVVTVLDEILTGGQLAFIDRPVAEVSDDWVQLIPYCLIGRGRELFWYTRRGSEGRLDGLRSIGVGGHINPCDAGDGYVVGADLYWRGLRRELMEEVGIELAEVPPPFALIYDPSNAVGKVHLGVCHRVGVPLNRELQCHDPALAGGAFQPTSEVLFECNGDNKSFERWSALLVKHCLS